MSGSFLYLAIVAVWAFVLVPRWLRRQHAQPQPSVELDVEYPADDAGPRYYYYTDAQDAEPHAYSPGAQESSYAAGADADMTEAVPAARLADLRVPQPRSRVLRARRRLLTMLVLLTAVGVACIALKITSWWVGVPPAGVLGIYLLLLREAALADAEQARRLVARQARALAARQRAYAAATEHEAEPSAQIIDISARVGDQLYDQYADAAVRAVGD